MRKKDEVKSPAASALSALVALMGEGKKEKWNNSSTFITYDVLHKNCQKALQEGVLF